MGAFADHCGLVAEAFPWLPEYLAAETARLHSAARDQQG
jgi:hypothetical protein